MATLALERPQQQSCGSKTVADSRAQLDALTSLRVVGAIAVVLQHSIFTFHLPHSIEKWNTTAALSFFFVLSGFILSYAHPRFEKKDDFINFFRARFARCWPLHIATMLLFAFWIKDGAGYDVNANPRIDVMLAQVFFVQAWTWDPNIFFSFNTPAWSISVEYFFYLCFPLIQCFRRTHGLLKAVLITVAAAGIAAACQSIGAHTHVPVFKTWVTYINPLSHLFEFSLGILCSALFVRLQKFNTVKVATAVQIAAVELGIYYFSHCNHISNVLHWFPVSVSYGLYSAIAILAFSLSNGWLARAISNRVLVKLGDMSYSVYLLHSVISHAFYPQWEYFAITKGRIAFFVYVAVVFMASYFCLEYFEAPMRRLLLGKRKSAK